MGVEAQHTVAKPVECAGVGLHTGTPARVVIYPAPEDHGIVFHRLDVDEPGGQPELHNPDKIIPASPDLVTAVKLGTTIANQSGASISTVEHLMAALAICHVDNVLIEIFGCEIPILDGSSAPFVEALNRAGRIAQEAPRRTFEVLRPHSIEDGDRSISVAPLDHFRLDVCIDFEDCVIGKQSLSITLDDIHDRERLAGSRTFCRLHEVEAMRTAGLIRGGSLENSIVVDGDRLLNGEQLRDPEEFALHKALDLIGDLYLLGGPVIGHVRAHKPGHDLNNQLARTLFNEPGIIAENEPLKPRQAIAAAE